MSSEELMTSEDLMTSDDLMTSVVLLTSKNLMTSEDITTCVDLFSSGAIFRGFLEIYPTTLHFSSLPSSCKPTVFWSHDDPESIQDKIRCAFQNLQLGLVKGLIQFWAPVCVCGGRQLLTTADQPFTLATLYNGPDKYRLCSLKYEYCANNNNNNPGGVEEEDDDVRIISDGAVSRAFLNQTPELLFPDLKVAAGSPLVSSALECGLMYSVMLPVFDPSQSGCCCVGVVECSTRSSTELLQVFNKLNTELEKEGLKTFHVRDRLPYKTMHGLEHVKNEIDEALKIIWHTHGLAFSHVWIPYKDENHVSLSSLEDGQAKRIIGLKLTGYYVNLDDENPGWPESFNNACYRLPFKMGEGIIGYEPYFIDNLELSENESVLKLLSVNVKCSCFVIYLRSAKTRDLDYAFEFLWSKDRDSVILLESLLLTLKRCLPSFKFASGPELGDGIDILDVRNSRGRGKEYIKIFQRNKISIKRERESMVEECIMPSKAESKTAEKKLTRKQIEAEFGKTQYEAAKNLDVSLTTLRRKCKKLGILNWPGKGYVKKNQSDMNEEEDGGAIQDNIREMSLDENMVTIKAEYAGDVIKFTHPISSATSEAIKKVIVEIFNLDHTAHYKLKYLDDEDNEWILFTCDEDVALFTKNKRNVRLCLLPRD